jgi:hypothetical protein
MPCLAKIFYNSLSVWVLATLAFASTNVHSQDVSGLTRQATIYQGDTIPYIELPTIRYFAPRIFANRFEEAKYYRLVRNVKRVYPYARLAGIKFQEYSELLAEIESETQRRKITKEIEQQIKDEFEGELRRLTFTQGHILIKLIDRETKHTSYEVLRDFRGVFSAVFWQSFGRIFGYNLKNQYDPLGEDRLIEEIVQLIEQGAI